MQSLLGPKIPDLFRHCSGDSESAIDGAGKDFYATGPNLFSQGSILCWDRVHTYQTGLRALSTSRTSPGLPWWRTAVTTTTPPAHDVAIEPIATNPGSDG